MNPFRCRSHVSNFTVSTGFSHFMKTWDSHVFYSRVLVFHFYKSYFIVHSTVIFFIFFKKVNAKHKNT